MSSIYGVDVLLFTHVNDQKRVSRTSASRVRVPPFTHVNDQKRVRVRVPPFTHVNDQKKNIRCYVTPFRDVNRRFCYVYLRIPDGMHFFVTLAWKFFYTRTAQLYVILLFIIVCLIVSICPLSISSIISNHECIHNLTPAGILKKCYHDQRKVQRSPI